MYPPTKDQHKGISKTTCRKYHLPTLVVKHNLPYVFFLFSCFYAYIVIVVQDIIGNVRTCVLLTES